MLPYEPNMGLPEGCVVLWVWLALEFNLDRTEVRRGFHSVSLHVSLHLLQMETWIMAGLFGVDGSNWPRTSSPRV